MTLPELLCPAGDMTALEAAVVCGADAVYLGYSRFGARASAVNFDAAALRQAVRFAHLYHVRVHVTVNTLVKQAELMDVREALHTIADARADAVIVQDLGVADIVRREFPTLALHASTQMALSNAADASWALENGFSRAVLARECSLEDIRAVAQTGIETEVFAHGALCASVSGRCLISSMSGGRSGNRGRCAQPCRQCYRLGSREGALMSMRDLCLIDDLPALIGAGVSSLKIEGRLKSAEYVAVVTSAYRRVLDDIAQGGRGAATDDERLALRQIFNRGGFTRGHAMGEEDAALVYTSRVDHDGVRLGTVTGVRDGFALVKPDAALNDGDSLRICGARDIELRYSGKDMPAGQPARVRLRPGEAANIGDAVARLADARQLEWARGLMPKPIPVTMQAELKLGKPLRLAASDGETAVTVSGDIAQTARSASATQTDVRKQLERLGGTPFALNADASLDIDMDEGLFLPVSALNALRRDAVERLQDERIAAFERAGAGESAHKASMNPQTHRNTTAGGITPQTLAVIYSDAAVSRELMSAGATMLIYEPADYRPEPLRAALEVLPDGVWLQLPQQVTQSALEGIAALAREYARKLGGVALGSIGQLALGLPTPVIAGEGVPICNREALQSLRDTPLCGFTLWTEWTKDELMQTAPFDMPALLKVYGREPLMLLNHCPERVMRGLRAERSACAICDEGDMACGMPDAALTDRMGYRFPLQRLRMPEGCVLRVVGALPTLISDEVARKSLGAGALMRFTVEPRDRQIALVGAFSQLMNGCATDADAQALRAEKTTTGHWRRVTE